MKGKAKAGYVLARIAEVFMWVTAALTVVSFLAVLIAPEAVTAMSGAGVKVVVMSGALGRVDVMDPDGTLNRGLYLLYTAVGAAQLSLTALVFRRIWQIIKLRWASTPFQRPVVDRVKQIGWLVIAVPLVTLAVSFISYVLCWPGHSFQVDVSGLITGVIVLALAQIFAYGVKLENDVEGLL